MAIEVTFDGKDDFDGADREKMLTQIGWYLTTLKDTSIDNKNGSLVLDFEVCYGPFVGATTKKFLGDPAMQNDEKKIESAIKMFKAWAKRMGAITEAEALAGKQADFIRLIGDKFVLDTEMGQPNAQGQQYVNPKYVGVYPVDHPKIPANVRADLKLGPPRELKPGESGPPAASKTTGAAKGGTVPAAGNASTGSPQVDVSDL